MNKFIKEFFAIIIGCAFMALGIDLFLLPNQLSSGGFSGIATLLYYLININIGTTVLILNIPLFIIALFKLGKRFFAKAIIGTLILSLFLNLFEYLLKDAMIVTHDKLLASIYGGLVVRNWNFYYFKI